MQVLEQYKHIFEFKGRYIFLLSGAGTGKSYVMAQRIIADMLTMENCFWLCTRKHHTDVGRSVFLQVKDVIWETGLQKYFNINKSDRTISSKINNSKVQFTGVDDPNKIKSIAEVTHVFMEEADEMSEDDFDILDSRCRSKNTHFNQLVLAFNPPEKTHWIPVRWFKTGTIMPEYNEPLKWSENINNTNLEYLALRTHYHHNPYLPQDSKAKYESFEKHNYAFYERYCLGTWLTSMAGTFFDAQHIKYGTQLGRNIIYLDPAYSMVAGEGDYTCILKTSYINNKFHINNCTLKQNMIPNEVLDNLLCITF